MIKMISLILYVFFVLFIALIALFPLFSFRVPVDSTIFPALDIIFIYYLTTYHSMKYLHLLIITIYFDQIYAMPIGSNLIAFITINLLLQLINKKVSLKSYLINNFIFYVYCAFALCVKYLILVIMNGNIYVDIFRALLQYLTTIFIYPLMVLFLDTFNNKLCKIRLRSN